MRLRPFVTMRRNSRAFLCSVHSSLWILLFASVILVSAGPTAKKSILEQQQKVSANVSLKKDVKVADRKTSLGVTRSKDQNVSRLNAKWRCSDDTWRYDELRELDDVEDEVAEKRDIDTHEKLRAFDDMDESRGFSFLDMVENVFLTVTSGLGAFVNNFVSTESKSSKVPANRVNYKNYQLLRIFPNSKAQVRELKELMVAEPDEIKFWTIPSKNGSTDVLVSPTYIEDVKDFLKTSDYNFTILIPDLQKTITNQNPKMSKEQRQELVSNKGHSMTWKRYHRIADINGYLDYLALNFPNLVTLETIGSSFEGQPIKLVKVSSGPSKDGEQKPTIWIDAGMHAREWIGPAVATYILTQLVEKHSSYAKLLDTSDWMILPVVNPDGYEYSHTTDRLWRKTRSNHADAANEARSTGFFQLVSHYAKWLFARCEGVDPNRNFGFHWGERKIRGASSDDPCHDTYSGPTAFSEPETRAMADYIMQHRQNIRAYLTLHSYSQMLLVPWGYTRSKPADYEELMNIAKKATKSIAKVHGTQYQVGPSSNLLYPTSGASDDWAKGEAGIKYSYTMELRDQGKYGFLLPASQIVPTARETWAGIRAIARLVICNT